MIGRFMFELSQTGASRAECDGPKDIQQAGSTKGEAPQKPVQIDKGLACGEIPSLVRYKHVHSYEAHSYEHHQLDQGQEINGEINGLRSVPTKEHAEVGKKEDAIS